MTIVRILLTLAAFVALMWTVSAAEVSLEDGAEEGDDDLRITWKVLNEKGRDSKVKPKDIKKAFKEAALLLQVVANLFHIVTMIIGPVLLLKGVSISAFTALVTFFWFVYELLKAKDPTKVSVVLPPSVKLPHQEEQTTTSRPTVAILPVVASHEVHTYDYDDYGDVYNYKQHFGNKRHNLNRPNLHFRR